MEGQRALCDERSKSFNYLDTKQNIQSIGQDAGKGKLTRPVSWEAVREAAGDKG